MTLASNQDWAKVEAVAAQHEIREQDHFLPVKPVPVPTQAQQLAFAVADLTRCKARLKADQECFAVALMELQLGNTDRAKQVLIQGWASL